MNSKSKLTISALLLGFAISCLVGLLFLTGCGADKPKPLSAKMGNTEVSFWPVFNNPEDIEGYEFYVGDSYDKEPSNFTKIENVSSMNDLGEQSSKRKKKLYYKNVSSNKELNCVCQIDLDYLKQIYSSLDDKSKDDNYDSINNSKWSDINVFEWDSADAHFPKDFSSWFKKAFFVNGISAPYFNEDGSLNQELAQFSNVDNEGNFLEPYNTNKPKIFGVEWGSPIDRTGQPFKEKTNSIVNAYYTSGSYRPVFNDVHFGCPYHSFESAYFYKVLHENFSYNQEYRNNTKDEGFWLGASGYAMKERNLHTYVFTKQFS